MLSRIACCLVVTLFLILVAGCTNHPASDSVKAFSIALEDSAWGSAWNMLTPETQIAWDSTAVILHEFGYTESRTFLESLNSPVTEEEFQILDGAMLFERMVSSSPEITNLSRSVRSVELSDSLTALVKIATSSGEQIIPVKFDGVNWLIDLTTLSPPPEILVE